LYVLTPQSEIGKETMLTEKKNLSVFKLQKNMYETIQRIMKQGIMITLNVPYLATQAWHSGNGAGWVAGYPKSKDWVMTVVLKI